MFNIYHIFYFVAVYLHYIYIRTVLMILKYIHLEIYNAGRLKTKLCNKRDDFTFPIANFNFISSNIPSSPAHGDYISHHIRYTRACAHYSDYKLLAQMLLKQDYVPCRLKSSLSSNTIPLEKYGNVDDSLKPLLIKYNTYSLCIPRSSVNVSKHLQWLGVSVVIWL